MSEPLLKVENVTRCFRAGDRDVAVLKGVDLSIDAGEFVAIVGPSGSGKSTLMNLLGCLDLPSSGSYRIAGCETGALCDDALARLRRERFGFVFQRYHLLAHLSALANVMVPAIYAGTARRVRERRAAHLLGLMGLAGRADHRPAQLSGGQQQRVAIARALMNGGEIILADEPTGALDSGSGQEVIDILSELNALGHTIVIVTHDAAVAARAARIIEMRDGEVVADRCRMPGDERMVGRASTTADLQTVGAPTARRSAHAARLAEVVRVGWEALLSHRLRTLLTMLGIIIGIASVVTTGALGEGAKRHVLAQINSAGTNTIAIYPGRDWGDTRAASIETLVPADAIALAAQPYIDRATPEITRSLLLRHRNVDANAMVNGVGEHHFEVRGMRLAAGVPFGAAEVRRQAQVAVIDQHTRRKLFGTDLRPLGKVILVDTLPCVVIGVMADTNDRLANPKQLNVWLPYTTAAARLAGQHHLDSITVRVRDGQPGALAEKSLIRLLSARHGRKDFFTYNVDSIAKMTERTAGALTLLLALIAVVSLLVGGIGVMNIMLVSVTERTREIGIRIAVGARQRDVMCQFLAEALLVCVASGLIGIALSLGIGWLFSLWAGPWRMVFCAGPIVSALLCAMVTGLVFGYAPARKAARMRPVDALARD